MKNDKIEISMKAIYIVLILLAVVTVSGAQNVQYVAAVHCPNINDVRIVAGYAHCIASDGLVIYDISDPSAPDSISELLLPGQGHGIHVTGSFAYIADGSYGLQIVNVLDRANPFVVGSYDTPDVALGIFVSGLYAYVADAGSGLQIIDVSNRSNPQLVATFDNYAGAPLGVFVTGDYAYIAEGLSGLEILDISNPDSLMPLGIYDTPGYANSVFILGEYAYVADESGGLQIIDVSIATNPVLAGAFPTLGWTFGLTVSDRYAYLADNDAGLQIVDISDPAEPLLAGSYDSLIQTRGVAVSGDYVYVADRDSLFVLRFTPTAVDDGADRPISYSLMMNYPNPFNAQTTLILGTNENARIGLFDITGRRVATIYAKNGKAIWDASGFSSGFYFAQLESGEKNRIIKMVLLK
jgi:hypothetical protein